ncbi:high affinity cAMP-specific and IBMX-insensitive 3':5'-cyclic phosphodiesterase 8B-like isoform X3 [Leptotrombidium deliense]|uniref:3',5'-cyclic-AMP phosphodiesterase n=1 Tax=Leptotrombidium deliense TaxID=299467 RepID=A0A443SLP4_9ACAR|nr:high affinity cAMP-specific and IBMX-insensitive 3':5'-cyclic phosphodiesterase 8B-like isoform X3 [Leptotrombidium deliense]
MPTNSTHFNVKAAQTLYSALDMCRDGIIITTANHQIEYMNRSMEKLLGYKLDEMIGKLTNELHKTDSQKNDIYDSINSQLQKGKEWEGTLLHIRKSGELLPLWSRIKPVDITNGTAEHLVYVKECPYYAVEKMFSPEGEILPFNYGSIKGNRKASYDVKSLCSEGKISGLNRRHSFAKFHAMTIEAPISKVINILMATQENSPVFVAQALDKVLDILRGSELYSPPITGFQQPNKEDDQVTSDLFTGLIHSNKATGIRRMSHEQVVQKNSLGVPQTPTQLPSLTNIPPNIKNLLDSQLDWEFNIIELEQVTNNRPLVWLGLSILSVYNVCATLNCDEVTLRNWLTVIESNYHDNPYHNSTHAADVMQATAYYLRKPRLKEIFDPLDEAICLLSAIVHDVDHPGKNSAFLCNSRHDLAVLYNDISVLESHHAALAFKLTISDESVNIFKNLDRDTFKEVRQSIIDMVLATEMTKHFEHLSKFVNVFSKPLSIEEAQCSQTETIMNDSTANTSDISSLATPENVVLIKRMLIKCADVSNPVRPQKLCTVWAHRIADEYCNQTDEEKSRGLPVVMPAFDRQTCSIPKSQIGFIDYFANDMFEAWDAFGEFPELLDYLHSNHVYWLSEEKRRVSGGSLQTAANN